MAPISITSLKEAEIQFAKIDEAKTRIRSKVTVLHSKVDDLATQMATQMETIQKQLQKLLEGQEMEVNVPAQAPLASQNAFTSDLPIAVVKISDVRRERTFADADVVLLRVAVEQSDFYAGKSHLEVSILGSVDKADTEVIQDKVQNCYHSDINFNAEPVSELKYKVVPNVPATVKSLMNQYNLRYVSELCGIVYYTSNDKKLSAAHPLSLSCTLDVQYTFCILLTLEGWPPPASSYALQIIFVVVRYFVILGVALRHRMRMSLHNSCGVRFGSAKCEGFGDRNLINLLECRLASDGAEGYSYFMVKWFIATFKAALREKFIYRFPLFATAVHNSHNEEIELAKLCGEEKYGGTLQMQSDLDSLSAKLSLNIRDCGLLIKIDVLGEASLPTSSPSKESLESRKYRNLQEFLAHLQIGHFKSKRRALDNLVESVKDDGKYGLSVLGRDISFTLRVIGYLFIIDSGTSAIISFLPFVLGSFEILPSDKVFCMMLLQFFKCVFCMGSKVSYSDNEHLIPFPELAEPFPVPDYLMLDRTHCLVVVVRGSGKGTSGTPTCVSLALLYPADITQMTSVRGNTYVGTVQYHICKLEVQGKVVAAHFKLHHTMSNKSGIVVGSTTGLCTQAKQVIIWHINSTLAHLEEPASDIRTSFRDDSLLFFCASAFDSTASRLPRVLVTYSKVELHRWPPPISFYNDSQACWSSRVWHLQNGTTRQLLLHVILDNVWHYKFVMEFLLINTISELPHSSCYEQERPRKRPLSEELDTDTALKKYISWVLESSYSNSGLILVETVYHAIIAHHLQASWSMKNEEISSNYVTSLDPGMKVRGQSSLEFLSGNMEDMDTVKQSLAKETLRDSFSCLHLHKASEVKNSTRGSFSCYNSDVNKPHKGNDTRWDVIQAVRSRGGMLGINRFRLLKRLVCGDICGVYQSELRSSHFEKKQFSCLVMEFCLGGDLRALRQRQLGKYFSENAARFYEVEVLLVLEYLHMLDIIYRDLKQGNVLVREDDHIMLLDSDLSLRCVVSLPLAKSSNPYIVLSKNSSNCVQPHSLSIVVCYNNLAHHRPVLVCVSSHYLTCATCGQVFSQGGRTVTE